MFKKYKNKCIKNAFSLDQIKKLIIQLKGVITTGELKLKARTSKDKLIEYF